MDYVAECKGVVLKTIPTDLDYVAWSAGGSPTDAGSGSVTAKNAEIERRKISSDMLPQS